MNRTNLIRIGLGYLGLSALTVGLWAQLAPQSFYDSFPGFGQVWVAVDGPYNEHLIRDVGGLNLALAVLIGVAAWKPTRVLAQTASAAALVYGVPHLVYHMFNTGGLDTMALVTSLGGLVAFAIVPVAIVVLARHMDAERIGA